MYGLTIETHKASLLLVEKDEIKSVYVYFIENNTINLYFREKIIKVINVITSHLLMGTIFM